MAVTPPIITEFQPSDTNHTLKLNTNFQNLLTGINGLIAELEASQAGYAYGLYADSTRRIDSTDALGGRRGSRSFVPTFTSTAVSLESDNQDGVSYCIINGLQKQHAGTLSLNFSTLGLGDGNYTYYLGVDASGQNDVTIAVDQTKTNIELPLYSFLLNVSGSGTTFATARLRTLDRSQLFANTLLQDEMSRVRHHEFRWMNESATPDDFHVVVPYKHILLGGAIVVSEASGTANLVFELYDQASSTSLVTMNYVEATTGIGALARQAAGANYVNVVRDADTVYRWSLFSGSGAVYSGVLLVEVLPVYGIDSAGIDV